MQKVLLLALFVLASTHLVAQLTIEKIMQDPDTWIGTSPDNLSWSEDSETLYFTWNPDHQKSDSLYKITLTDRIPRKVSVQEKQERISAFPSAYNSDRTKKLYIKNNNLFLLDLQTKENRQLTATLSRKTRPGFTTFDDKVYFIEDENVFIFHLNDGSIHQLTNFVNSTSKPESKPSPADQQLEKDQLELFDVLKSRKENREARETYNKNTAIKTLKELPMNGKNLQNIEVSPDLKFVTYRLMETPKGVKNTFVPSFVTESGYTESLNARSKVGAPQSSFESFIYDIEGDTIIKISTKNIPGIKDQPDFVNDYPKDTSSNSKTPTRGVIINGPVWSPNASHGIVVIRSQDNKDRWIMELNPKTAELNLIDRQRDEAWIAGPGIGFATNPGNIGFIHEDLLYFQSEATGYSHLYIYDFATGTKKALTSGDFEVRSASLSNDKTSFYMTTSEVHPGESHYYKMSVNGGERIKLTSMTGGNEIELSPDEKTIAIRYSNSNTPWELYLQENKAGAKAEQITKSTTPEFNAYAWKKPEIITVIARDGKDIYARLYKPTKKTKNGKAVIFVHGAGYLQNAHKWWSSYFREYMFHNLLVDKGYTVLDMDYRASAGYGRDIRTGIYRFMGGKDLSDNVDGAKYLVEKQGINPKKIGIYGGSYGGFITLMAMFNEPDVFAAGAALRPVTDWAAYNHGYTSNILNEPQTDSIAYRRSSPIFHANGLKGDLLICHGMVDVNVHIQDSYRLVQRLIELKKENWEMASYPVEDHGFVEPTSWMDEYKRILKLFEEKM